MQAVVQRRLPGLPLVAVADLQVLEHQGAVRGVRLHLCVHHHVLRELEHRAALAGRGGGQGIRRRPRVRVENHAGHLGELDGKLLVRPARLHSSCGRQRRSARRGQSYTDLGQVHDEGVVRSPIENRLDDGRHFHEGVAGELLDGGHGGPHLLAHGFAVAHGPLRHRGVHASLRRAAVLLAVRVRVAVLDAAAAELWWSAVLLLGVVVHDGARA
mmetsp:Transcript_43572/g.123306  ORF Transcript_43572/g.123306 Transcript_43572/m.123306 type:complete len:214 (-) Transcript_43572:124-765(-)